MLLQTWVLSPFVLYIYHHSDRSSAWHLLCLQETEDFILQHGWPSLGYLMDSGEVKLCTFIAMTKKKKWHRKAVRPVGVCHRLDQAAQMAHLSSLHQAHGKDPERKCWEGGMTGVCSNRIQTGQGCKLQTANMTWYWVKNTHVRISHRHTREKDSTNKPC